MKTTRHILFLLLLSGFPCAHAETMKLEIIPLQNRTTDDVIPIIRPLIAPGGTVAGMNNQLIVKTTPSNLDEIRQILQSIDKAARRLMIYVKQDIDGDNYRREQSVSGRYSNDNVTISGNERPDSNRGVTVTAGDDKGNNVRYRDLSTRSDLEDKNTFQVQAVEGRPAFIQSGVSVPIPNQNTYISHGHVVVQETTEYRDVTSGFYVLPQLNGDRVTLLISPNLSRLNPHQGGVIDVQNVETTAIGRLGEWISIGGLDRNSSSSSSGILSSTRHQNQEQRTVLIKVEEIP